MVRIILHKNNRRISKHTSTGFQDRNGSKTKCNGGEVGRNRRGGLESTIFSEVPEGYEPTERTERRVSLDVRCVSGYQRKR
jgi:hypothetical protein